MTWFIFLLLWINMEPVLFIHPLPWQNYRTDSDQLFGNLRGFFSNSLPGMELRCAQVCYRGTRPSPGSVGPTARTPAASWSGRSCWSCSTRSPGERGRSYTQEAAQTPAQLKQLMVKIKYFNSFRFFVLKAETMSVAAQCQAHMVGLKHVSSPHPALTSGDLRVSRVSVLWRCFTYCYLGFITIVRFILLDCQLCLEISNHTCLVL